MDIKNKSIFSMSKDVQKMKEERRAERKKKKPNLAKIAELDKLINNTRNKKNRMKLKKKLMNSKIKS